jgi:hypothetical protein
MRRLLVLLLDKLPQSSICRSRVSPPRSLRLRSCSRGAERCWRRWTPSRTTVPGVLYLYHLGTDRSASSGFTRQREMPPVTC